MLDFDFVRENWVFIASGMGETLLVSILAMAPATLVALVVGMGRRSTFLPNYAASTFYISVIGGTPLILQIFFVFLALPQLGIFLPGLLAGALVLGLNSSARLGEAFRGWFASGEDGQRKAWHTLIPLLSNEFIALIKDSALISVTGFVHDILWRARKVGRAEFHNLEALTIAVMFYWVLILIIVIAQNQFVKRAKSDNL